MHYFYIIYNSVYHIFCSLHSSFCFGSLVPIRTQRKWKCEHGSLRADRTDFLTNWNFARHGLCTRAHAQRCDLQYSRASTRAILTAMLLNCRDRGVKGRRGGAGICMDHGRRRRCTWPNDQARCVSRTTRLLLILLVFSPFFFVLSFFLRRHHYHRHRRRNRNIFNMHIARVNWRTSETFLPLTRNSAWLGELHLCGLSSDIYLGELLYQPHIVYTHKHIR